jgi:ferritin-like metal-binding protein YciE
MGLFSRDIKSMDDLFIHTLQDIYYAENKIVQSLPDMIDKAADAQLKQGLQSHLGETKDHVKRIEQVFRMYRQEPKAIDCPAIDGILEEAEDVVGEVEGSDVLYAAIVADAQAVEHYEITRYGSLIAWAKQLGRSDCVGVLEKTLAEDKAADKKLTALAERKVKVVAAARPQGHAECQGSVLDRPVYDGAAGSSAIETCREDRGRARGCCRGRAVRGLHHPRQSPTPVPRSRLRARHG